jgi:hypothetical protein
MEESFRRFFVAVDSCLLVPTTLGETLDLGLPDWTMAVCGVLLPHGDIVLGVDVGWRGSKVEQFSSTSTSPNGVVH